MKTRIRAEDVAMLHYTAQSVWSVIGDIKKYPQWWPKSLNLILLSIGKKYPVGTTLRIKPSWGREFFCRVESSDGEGYMLFRYFGGFITGKGEWRVDPLPDGCSVSYRLDVESDSLLVALIGLFVDLGRMHSQMMEKVLKELEKELSKRERDFR